MIGDKNEAAYLTNASVGGLAAQMLPRYSQTEERWQFDEKPDEDVITLCERYLSSASTLVYERREKFDTVGPN